MILVGADEPELRIDDTGTILSKENITVRERLINGTLSAPKAVGQTITPGATIVVDDIVFTPGGKATFHANTQDENDDDVDVDATIIGTQGEFDFRESYETITILNASDRDMETRVYPSLSTTGRPQGRSLKSPSMSRTSVGYHWLPV